MDKTITLLLFEDNPGDAGLIKKMLEKSTDSYKLKNVETLYEGLNLLKSQQFNVILLDLGLPDSDGINTFLNVHSKSFETPIIILTGLNDEKVGINAVKKGAQDYLVKRDVDSRLLERSIRYSIERKRTEVEKQKLLEEVQQFAEELEVSNEELQATTEELQAANRELEFASKYNRSLIEASLDPFVTIGPDGKITDVNCATESVTGCSRDELIGTCFPDYFTDSKKAQSGYRQVFLEGEVRDYALEIKHKDGQVTPVLYHSSVYYDESGRVSGVFAAARDITERKKAEGELKRVVEELKRSNEELQQFAYITSHDLQEPLRTIASFAQLIERRYKGQIDSDVDDYIDFIVDAAVRMKDMIQGLLYYSRVGTRGEELESINIEELLEIVLSDLHVIIEENEAEITYDELPILIADKKQLIQLFQNIISNAIKFRKVDEQPKIHISACKDKERDEYVFSIADNGIGIESEYFNQIFKVFKRLHTIDKYEGTGIGLAISKRIIECHGGEIWIESEFGNGSTFYFTLPKT